MSVRKTPTIYLPRDIIPVKVVGTDPGQFMLGEEIGQLPEYKTARVATKASMPIMMPTSGQDDREQFEFGLDTWSSFYRASHDLEESRS